MLKGIDTSAIAYITALSPTAISAAGSGNAIDLSKYTQATLVVSSGSTGAGTLNFDVLRSSASDGTFHNFGASISAVLLGQRYVRSFTVGSSDVWYKVFYTALGAASPVMDAMFAAAGVREAPIDQPSGTTSHSVINSA